MEEVESLALDVSKGRLDVTLSALVQVTRWCLVTAQTRWPQRSFPQPNCLCDSLSSHLELSPQ